MSIQENVMIGRSAKDVFAFALNESQGLTTEGTKRFWTRLGQLVNEQLRNATEAPAPNTITDDESRKIGKLTMPRGKHGPTDSEPGKTIDQTPMDYLEWVADNWTCEFGEQIRRYLDSPRIKSERR